MQIPLKSNLASCLHEWKAFQAQESFMVWQGNARTGRTNNMPAGGTAGSAASLPFYSPHGFFNVFPNKMGMVLLLNSSQLLILIYTLQ